MDISSFVDKNFVPTIEDLQNSIADTFELWQLIKDYTLSKYPKGREEWNYPGKNYGWGFRIKDTKRAILYFLPRPGYFYVAFVFGERAVEKINDSSISESIKNELKSARVYAEGRGIRIKVTNSSMLGDIKRLIDIKLEF